MSGRDRRGYTLAEAMSALVVAGMLTLGLASVLALVARAAARHARLAAVAETERTAPAILDAELRTHTAADVTFGDDSLRLRAFRGGGLVCARTEAELIVAWEGVRAPEPEKDSVLVVWDAGESAFRVESVRAGACEDAPALRITPSQLPADGALPLAAFVFETGAYSVAASAFRYRRGAAGRQPLTEETLSSGSTVRARLPFGAGALVDVRLVSRYPDAAGGIDWLLTLPQGGSAPPERGNE